MSMSTRMISLALIAGLFSWRSSMMTDREKVIGKLEYLSAMVTDLGQELLNLRQFVEGMDHL